MLALDPCVLHSLAQQVSFRSPPQLLLPPVYGRNTQLSYRPFTAVAPHFLVYRSAARLPTLFLFSPSHGLWPVSRRAFLLPVMAPVAVQRRQGTLTSVLRPHCPAPTYVPSQRPPTPPTPLNWTPTPLTPPTLLAPPHRCHCHHRRQRAPNNWQHLRHLNNHPHQRHQQRTWECVRWGSNTGRPLSQCLRSRSDRRPFVGNQIASIGSLSLCRYDDSCLIHGRSWCRPTILPLEIAEEPWPL